MIKYNCEFTAEEDKRSVARDEVLLEDDPKITDTTKKKKGTEIHVSPKHDKKLR
jgi:hypothetical protein